MCFIADSRCLCIRKWRCWNKPLTVCVVFKSKCCREWRERGLRDSVADSASRLAVLHVYCRSFAYLITALCIFIIILLTLYYLWCLNQMFYTHTHKQGPHRGSWEPCEDDSGVCVSGAHLYRRNASRTNKTSAAGIVRVAQRNTDTERENERAVRYGFSFSSTPRDSTHSHLIHTHTKPEDARKTDKGEHKMCKVW